MSGIKQPLGVKLCLQLLERDLKIADPLRHKLAAVELIDPVPRIDGYAPPYGDAHSVFRTKTELSGTSLEHHAFQTALGILERKIVMPGGIDFVI